MTQLLAHPLLSDEAWEKAQQTGAAAASRGSTANP
jgi:hypothetical protein